MSNAKTAEPNSCAARLEIVWKDVQVLPMSYAGPELLLAETVLATALRHQAKAQGPRGHRVT
jgi:hypothetical protein